MIKQVFDKQVFDRRWIFSTLVVILLTIVFIRLGFWQLDRLQTRRARVAETKAQLDAAPLILDAETLDIDLTDMEYRTVQVTGVYDPSGEVVLRNQVWADPNLVRYNGFHLLTPLIIEGSSVAVIVDRGWIPTEESSPSARASFIIDGTITVTGIIRVPQGESQLGLLKEPDLPDGETRRDAWNFANVDGIGKQMDIPLLPVYIQEEPDGQDTALPYAVREYPDLSEGSHLGFAFQWFALAAIALIGYPILIQRQPESRTKKNSKINR